MSASEEIDLRVGRAMVAITAKMGSRSLFLHRTDGIWSVSVGSMAKDVVIQNASLAVALARANENLREEKQ